MFADNCHVHVHLQEADSTNTMVSGQLKSHLLQNGGLVVANDLNQSRTFHVDKVWDKKMNPLEMFQSARLSSLADATLEGFNTALIMLGVTRGSVYNRTSVFDQVLLHLESELKNGEEAKVSYALLGMTDSKCVNLVSEKPIHNIPEDGIDALMVRSKSISEIREKIARGSSLPYLLCLRTEYASTHIPTGYMLLADLGTPNFASSNMLGMTPSLTKSVDALRDVVKMLINPELTGNLPHMDNRLCALLTSFLGGTAITRFVFDLELSDKLTLAEVDKALSFAEMCRQVRSRPVSNFVDSRLLHLLTVHTHLQEECHGLQQKYVEVSLDLEEKEKDQAQFKKEMEEQLETAARMITDLQDQVSQLQTQGRDTQDNLTANHQKTIQDLRDTQDKLSQLQRSSVLRETELEHEVHQLRTDKAKLNEDLRRVTTAKSSVETRIDILERENRLMSDEVKHLTTKLKSTTGELQDAKAIISGLDADRESLERLAREKTAEAERSQRQLEDALKSMSLGTAEQRGFQREVEAVNREKDALARERDAIIREKNAVEKQKELVEAEVILLRKQKMELESENQRLKQGGFVQPYMMMPAAVQPIRETVRDVVPEVVEDDIVEEKPAPKPKKVTKPKDPNAPKRVRKPKEPKETKENISRPPSPKLAMERPLSPIEAEAMDLQEEDDVGGILSHKKSLLPMDEPQLPVTSTPDSSFIMDEDGQRKKKRKLTLSRRGSQVGKNSLLASAVAGSAKKQAGSNFSIPASPIKHLLKENVIEKVDKPVEKKPKQPKIKPPSLPTNTAKVGHGLIDQKQLQSILSGFALPKLK